MRVDISDIKLEAGNHKTVPVQIAIDNAGDDTARFDRPFTGEAEIWNAGEGRLLVRVNVAGQATVVCSRCLTEFSLPMEVSFEEEFVEGAAPNESADTDDDEADEDELEESQRTITYYSGDEIDLSEPLRENVLLELPMKPLCNEDCEGLCPTCGTNLNEGPCTCAAGEKAPVNVDPRLAKLQELLRKPDSNT